MIKFIIKLLFSVMLIGVLFYFVVVVGLKNKFEAKEIIEMLTVVLGGVGLSVGLIQYSEGVEWKKNEFMLRLHENFRKKHYMILNSLENLENSTKFSTGKVLLVDDDFLETALSGAEKDKNEEHNVYLDCFNDFLDDLQNYYSFYSFGLISQRNLDFLTQHWIGILIGEAYQGKKREIQESINARVLAYKYLSGPELEKLIHMYYPNIELRVDLSEKTKV